MQPEGSRECKTCYLRLHPNFLVWPDDNRSLWAVGRLRAINLSAELCLQIVKEVMYRTLDFSVDGLAVMALASPTQHSDSILFPLSMTGIASLCKLPHDQLPQAKLQLSLEVIEVTLTPQHLQLLKSVLPEQQQEPSARKGAEDTPQRRVSMREKGILCCSANRALLCCC